MNLLSKSVPVTTLVVRAYILIWIPILVTLFFIMWSIQIQVSTWQAIHDSNSNIGIQPYTLSEPAHWVESAARSLRQTMGIQNTGYHALDYLLDLRFLLISFWIFSLLLSALIVRVLIKKIYLPLGDVAKSIGNLAIGELNHPIKIDGSQQIQAISTELERLRNRLGETEQQQMQFLRHVSHEIKTPLTSIKEGSRLLEEEALGKISSEQREVTDIINRSTAELQVSIENLLNYNSAISVQKIKQREAVDLVQLMHHVLEKQGIAFKPKELTVDIKTTPARIFADPVQIATVFDNLISNAIKFSPLRGVISIKIESMKRHINVIIQDDGPGILVDQREAIFSAFYVGAQINETPLKGTGLGLSIARQYCELHEATLELLDVADSDKSGACFCATFKRH